MRAFALKMKEFSTKGHFKNAKRVYSSIFFSYLKLRSTKCNARSFCNPWNILSFIGLKYHRIMCVSKDNFSWASYIILLSHANLIYVYILTKKNPLHLVTQSLSPIILWFLFVIFLFFFIFFFPFLLHLCFNCFHWQHQDEQQKQKYQHSSNAPHTAPLISKKHFPFDAPTSPRSVRTTEKTEALFTFEHRTDLTNDDNINGSGGYENGCSKVIVEGNKVYYHGSSNYKSDNKLSNGNGEARYRHDKLEKENACESSSSSSSTTTMQRLMHMTDENYYDEQTYSSYSKYSRRDGPWKNRHGSSNKSNSSNKATKSYPTDYVAFNSNSSSNSGSSKKQHHDDTMFPFDRASLTYDSVGDNSPDWTKRHLSSYGNNYYDSPSPDYDYYEQFRSAPRKSTASNVSSDGRILKELATLSRKQSLKMSKYEHPPSPSNTNTTTTTTTTTTIKTDQNHQSKNHISDSDAFSLPKPNAKTNSTSSDNNTIITTTTHNNATTISIVSQSSNSCANHDRNPVSQFEQIASKFDKIPSKFSPYDRKYSTTLNPTLHVYD